MQQHQNLPLPCFYAIIVLTVLSAKSDFLLFHVLGSFPIACIPATLGPGRAVERVRKVSRKPYYDCTTFHGHVHCPGDQPWTVASDRSLVLGSFFPSPILHLTTFT